MEYLHRHDEIQNQSSVSFGVFHLRGKCWVRNPEGFDQRRFCTERRKLGEYLVDLLGYFPIVMPFLTCDSLTLPIQLDLIELSNWLLMSSILICTHAAVRSNFSHRFHGAGIYSNYIYIYIYIYIYMC